MKPLISIIVPACNNETSIESCLESIVSQSLQEIEIIVIDDGSEDESPRLIRTAADTDQRIRTIFHPASLTASQARKDGVAIAQGSYIMFVDADDELEPGICEKLCSEMSRNPADIIQFGTKIINMRNAPDTQIKWLREFLAPYNGTLLNDKVFTGCFNENLYSFSLWNKIYKADVCKKAFSHIADGRFPRANDMYAFFMLAYFAESYRGLPEIVGYQYHYGAGAGGQSKLSRIAFENLCSMGLVADEIRRFLEDEGTFELHKTAYENARKNLLWDCFSKFRDNLEETDFGFGYDTLMKYWRTPEIVSLMIETYQGREKNVAIQLAECSSTVPMKREVKTIGVYYHRISCGGAEKVTCELINLWKQLGFEIVLFTDHEPDNSDYPLPDGVARVVIPSFFSTTKENYRTRAEFLSLALDEYRIDCFVYHAWESYLLLWDMLLIKGAKIPTVIYCHSAFSSVPRGLHAHFATQPFIFGLAEALVVLSESDRLYWSMFSSNVVKTINPVFVNKDRTERSCTFTPTVIWVGRISEEKRPLDAIRIFEKVHCRIPQARLLLVGGESPGSRLRDQLVDYIDTHDLSDCISLTGYQNDVVPYYLQATVQLATSEFEGYPLMLAEGKQCGLPCVMYELPYIAFFENPRGLFGVPMGSIDDAAQALCALLENPELCAKASEEALESARELDQYDFSGQWIDIFSSFSHQNERKSFDKAELTMWSSLFEAYEAGVAKHHKLLDKADRDLAAAYAAHDATIKGFEQSISYRIGRAITSIPRRIRGMLRQQ